MLLLTNPSFQDGAFLNPSIQDGASKLNPSIQDGASKSNPSIQDGVSKLNVASNKSILSIQDGAFKLNPSIQDGASKLNPSIQDGASKLNPSIQDGASKVNPSITILSKSNPLKIGTQDRLIKKAQPFQISIAWGKNEVSPFIFVVKFYPNFTTKRGSCRHLIFCPPKLFYPLLGSRCD